MLVIISLTNQLQVFTVEVSCLRSQLKDMQQHVFKQIYLSMGIKPDSDCKNRCLMENTCVSVNVGPPSKNGFRVCQLSDSDHIQHPDDLKPREGYQYWASKVGIFG